MEKSTSFRFYRISRHNKKQPTLLESFREIAKISKKGDREREIAADFRLRLEEFEDDGPAAVIGEVVRVQSTNMPSEIMDTGRLPLSTKNPLGHSIVFRFNHKKSVLVVQYEPRIASPGRLLDYVKACWGGASYIIEPMIKPESWERFNSGDVRKLSVRIAQPEHLGNVGKAHAAAASGIKAMSEAYSAPSIRIELSMGHKSGALSESIKTLAKSFFRASEDTSASVESMKAVAFIDDSREEIDLIEERLKIKETLPLDDRDPEKNYKIKKIFISKVMKEEGF